MTQSSLSNAYVAGQLPTNTQDNHKLYTSINIFLVKK